MLKNNTTWTTTLISTQAPFLIKFRFSDVVDMTGGVFQMTGGVIKMIQGAVKNNPIWEEPPVFKKMSYLHRDWNCRPLQQHAVMETTTPHRSLICCLNYSIASWVFTFHKNRVSWRLVFAYAVLNNVEISFSCWNFP